MFFSVGQLMRLVNSKNEKSHEALKKECFVCRQGNSIAGKYSSMRNVKTAKIN
ncbi:hypothetical protein FACS1894172_21090 [Spirochaetia bacterium]|nr:hypothetical protein FACS1894164_13690 [Spirochaetia bacterium]GHU37618.1 hypothetical protein FACS1894172_21090 [Spirochaetia bacterium]